MKPAPHRDEDLRIHLPHGIPGRRDRLVALRAKHVPATRTPDLLGHPMADRERRVQPLDPDDPRPNVTGLAPGGHDRLHRTQPRAQNLDQIERVVLHLRHRADRRDRVQDPLDRGRLERDDADGGVDRPDNLVDLAVADRADTAQLLGQDQIRLERRERLLVAVDRQTETHETSSTSTHGSAIT